VSKRELLEIALRPISGDRFQPTGFPDIGPALYDRPITENGKETWQSCLLVESAQSMANHLEATSWDKRVQKPVADFAGLPYVRVLDPEGNYLTSSRTEAHRLASAYVKDATLDGVSMTDVIRDRLGLKDNRPLAPREISQALFALDPMCLVHGVFFADKSWPGQPKVARALTAFVEAHDVRSAISGGVKRDEVQHSKDEDAGGSREGYGFVPFHRTEFVARKVVASFVLDLGQIASYGLDENATELLAVAARWEMRSLLDQGFRPRTACDLVPRDPELLEGVLPPLDEIADRLRVLIGLCGDQLGGGQTLDIVWDRKNAKKRTAKQAAGSSGASSEDAEVPEEAGTGREGEAD
jgi:CRISPR-associated protein Csb1